MSFETRSKIDLKKGKKVKVYASNKTARIYRDRECDCCGKLMSQHYFDEHAQQMKCV